MYQFLRIKNTNWPIILQSGSQVYMVKKEINWTSFNYWLALWFIMKYQDWNFPRNKNMLKAYIQWALTKWTPNICWKLQFVWEAIDWVDFLSDLWFSILSLNFSKQFIFKLLNILTYICIMYTYLLKFLIIVFHNIFLRGRSFQLRSK